MNILILADIHSDVEALSKVLDAAGKENIDLVVCPGNITNMSATDDDFTQMDFANLILQKIVGFGVPVFCVPGNHDPYDILVVFNDYNINLHNKKRTHNNMVFVGWGGALTPFNTLFEPTEKETKTHLTTLSHSLEKNNFILVLHNPPKNTKLDTLTNGEHVGSPAIRGFIEKTQPLLSISAHIHEAVGEDVLGKTKLFYPGPVFGGNYGVVTIKGHSVVCERKQIKI